MFEAHIDAGPIRAKGESVRPFDDDDGLLSEGVNKSERLAALKVFNAEVFLIILGLDLLADTNQLLAESLHIKGLNTPGNGRCGHRQARCAMDYKQSA